MTNPNVVSYIKHAFRKPLKPRVQGVARREWRFPLQGVQRRNRGLSGFPQGDYQDAKKFEVTETTKSGTGIERSLGETRVQPVMMGKSTSTSTVRLLSEEQNHKMIDHKANSIRSTHWNDGVIEISCLIDEPTREYN